VKRLPSSAKPNGLNPAAKAFLACLALICAAAASALAQTGAMSPYQGEKDGVTAGGKWMEFQSEDKMTGAKKVRFELLADNYLREDPEYKPRVELFCSGGKLDRAIFNPGARLGRPDYPGFWGQPKMEVMVRIDNTHDTHGWNWERDRVLAMDKGTTRAMIGSTIFKIEVRTRGGPEIAEFSPAGIDLGAVRQACDLKPKKP
jgi:opacity protein-like surface antigen